MEDIASREILDQALAIAALIDSHNGIKTVVVGVSGQCSFADYFVIATASSFTHLRGLTRHLEDYASGNGLSALNRKRRLPDDDEWVLVDFGAIIVHLMTETARDFYELEKLWFAGSIVYPA
jgi:ribosome-associated protein